MGTAKQSRALGENKVVTFDLTSTLDPTDEQLQALMEEITEDSLNGLPNFAKDLIRD